MLAATVSRLCLQPFSPDLAGEVARWVGTDREHRWVAPNTRPPLTGEKVLAWKKPGGRPLMLVAGEEAVPLAYGELNPTRRIRDDFWLGHLIVRPDARGRGIGTRFIRALLAEAFDVHAARRVSLIVFPDNAAALSCYGNAGFRLAGTEYHSFGNERRKHRLLRLECFAAP